MDQATARNIDAFRSREHSMDTILRSIVLFGANTACYKFALAEALYDSVRNDRCSLTLEELAEPFSRAVCRHLKASPKQSTTSSSSYLDACAAFNKGEADEFDLVEATVRYGFRYVLDAFPVVNGRIISDELYEYSRKDGRIVLHDSLLSLQPEKINVLQKEVESRWNLVEYAWDSGISKNLLSVQKIDGVEEIVEDGVQKRRAITSARNSLNGYQKGVCFYCPAKIQLEGEEVCDIDHFFPFSLQKSLRRLNLNGVWNLVLASRDCNRGPKGKFSLLPNKLYLEKLYARNEYLISSHHPLRESLIAQTGSTPGERLKFLCAVDDAAAMLLPNHRWAPIV